MNKQIFLSFLIGVGLLSPMTAPAQIFPAAKQTATAIAQEVLPGLENSLTAAAAKALRNSPCSAESNPISRRRVFVNPKTGKFFSAKPYSDEDLTELQQALNRAWQKRLQAYDAAQDIMGAKQYAREDEVFTTLLKGLQQGVPWEELQLQVAQIRVGELSENALQTALCFPLPTRSPNAPKENPFPVSPGAIPSASFPSEPTKQTPGELSPADLKPTSAIPPERLEKMIQDFQDAWAQGPITISKFRDQYGYWDIPSLTIARELSAAGVRTNQSYLDRTKRILVVSDFRRAKLANPAITAKQFYEQFPQHHDITYQTLLNYLKYYNQLWSHHKKDPYDDLREQVQHDYQLAQLHNPGLTVLQFWHESQYGFIPYEKMSSWLAPTDGGTETPPVSR